jgi:hypothetical protein
MSSLAVNNQGRPEARGAGAATVGVVLGLSGFMLVVAGSIMMAQAKRWGYYGDQIHDMSLFQNGYIVTAVGGGALVVALIAIKCNE